MDGYYNKNNDINTQSNLEDKNKMQFPTEQQLFPMPCSLVSIKEYHHNQIYEQVEQQKEKKQEHNQNQQIYDIMSRMPKTPTLPSNTKLEK
jgi:hypothetical protein